MGRSSLGALEMDILSILISRPRDTYGAALQEAYRLEHHRTLSLGAIYTVLERLERKGFLSSQWGEPTAVRGGRRKRLYAVTGAGALALERSSEKPHLFASLLPAGAC